MRWLVGLSLRNAIVIVALAVLLVIGAVRTLRTTPLDVFPEFAPPLVAWTVPPCMVTSRCTRVRPMPMQTSRRSARVHRAAWVSSIVMAPGTASASASPALSNSQRYMRSSPRRIFRQRCWSRSFGCRGVPNLPR